MEVGSRKGAKAQRKTRKEMQGPGVLLKHKYISPNYPFAPLREPKL